MTQSSAAAVYHDTNLAHLVDPHLAGCCLIKDLLHHLNLSIVVARPKRAHLHPNPNITTSVRGQGGLGVQVHKHHHQPYINTSYQEA